MKKILAALSLLLSASIPLVGNPSQPAPLMITLKPRQPNWRYEVVQSYPNGLPEKVVFYEPLAQGGERPVKEMDYYPNNRIRYEMDIAVAEGGSPAAEQWKSTLVPHGTRVEFSNEGELIQFAHYQIERTH
jgi:hypothetical protein